MARTLIFALTFMGLAGLDIAAVLLAIEGISPAALILHGVVAMLAATTPFLVPGNRTGDGRLNLSLLALVMAFLTPVVGIAVVAWLISRPGRNQRDHDGWPGIHLGNPCFERERREPIPPIENAMPLSRLVRRRAADSNFRELVPRLRQVGNRPAIASLQTLRDLPEAHTQFCAQSALATLLENRESKLDALRRAANCSSDSSPVEVRFGRWERLASALVFHAECGLIDPESRSSLVEEAADAFTSGLALLPDDPHCLAGLAHCHLLLDRLTRIPELLGRLHAIPGAQAKADELEIRYLSRLGRWRETARSARRVVSSNSPSAHLDPGLLTFWIGSRPDRAKS